MYSKLSTVNTLHPHRGELHCCAEVFYMPPPKLQLVRDTSLDLHELETDILKTEF